MKKRCTESKCRRIFTVTGEVPACPYCGRQYPRLAEPRISWILKVTRFPEARVFAISRIHKLTGLSLIESLEAYRSGHLELTFRSKEQAQLLAGTLNQNDFGTIVRHL